MRLGFVVTALVVAACAQPPASEDEPAASVTSTGSLTGTYWRLVELDGQPSIPGGGTREPHLRFTDRRVNGATGCNTLGGGYEVAAGRVRFTDLFSTRMACVEEDRMRQEARFVKALETADGFAIRGDTLILRAGDVVVARFVRGQ